MVVWFLPPASSWWQWNHQCDGGVTGPSLSLVTLSPMSCYLSLWTPPHWKSFTDALHFNPRSLTPPTIYYTVLSFSYHVTPSIKPECLHSTLLASNKLHQRHLPFFSTQTLSGKFFQFYFLFTPHHYTTDTYGKKRIQPQGNTGCKDKWDCVKALPHLSRY